MPGGNTVQIANLGELTGIASGLALLHATAADQLQTAVNQVGTLISLGAYLAAANAYAEAGNWRLHHLAQLGEAINGNATLANRIAAEASAASVAGFGALTTVTVDSNAAITTSLALANTLLAANDNRLRDLNTSLHTIDRSARDVNASLATVDARIANGLAAVVLAQNAGNLITATGAEVTVSALNAGNTIQAVYYAQSMGYQATLVAQGQTITQQLAELRQAVQQAGIVVAQETRAGAQFVGVRVEQVDDTLRRNAA